MRGSTEEPISIFRTGYCPKTQPTFAVLLLYHCTTHRATAPISLIVVLVWHGYFSTKSRISRYQCAGWGLIPLVQVTPGRLGRYARRMRRECRHSLPGILFQGDQPAFRSENMISSWLSTMSQFWHRACQCLTIRWEARYSIRRRESSLVNEGLFFVICRN